MSAPGTQDRAAQLASQAFLIHDLDDRSDTLVYLWGRQPRQRAIAEEQCWVVIPRHLRRLPDCKRANSYSDGNGRRARGGHDWALELVKERIVGCKCTASKSSGKSRKGVCVCVVVPSVVLNDDDPLP